MAISENTTTDLRDIYIYVYTLNHLNTILYSTKLKFIVLMLFYCGIDINIANYKVIIYALTD